MGKSWRLLKQVAQFLLPDAASTSIDGLLTYGLQRVRSDDRNVLDPPTEDSRFALDCATVTWRADELVDMFAEAIGAELKWEGFEDESRTKFPAPVASLEEWERPFPFQKGQRKTEHRDHGFGQQNKPYNVRRPIGCYENSWRPVPRLGAHSHFYLFNFSVIDILLPFFHPSF
jgi:hypothetical protein